MKVSTKRFPTRNWGQTMSQARGITRVVTTSRTNYQAVEKKVKPHISKALNKASEYSRKIQRSGIERTAFGGGNLYAPKPVTEVKKKVTRFIKGGLYA